MRKLHTTHYNEQHNAIWKANKYLTQKKLGINPMVGITFNTNEEKDYFLSLVDKKGVKK